MANDSYVPKVDDYSLQASEDLLLDQATANLFALELGDTTNQFAGVEPQAEESTALEDIADFAVDAVTNPIDFGTSVAVTAGVDLLNIPLMFFGEHLQVEDYLSDSGAEFYEEHKTGVSLMSLLVVGGGAIGVASKAFSKGVKLAGLYRNGTVSAFDGGTELAAISSAKQSLAQAGLHSQEYKKQLRSIWTNSIGKGFAEGAAQEAVFAVATSQNMLMEDYSVGDYIVGAALGGGVSTLLRGVPAQLAARKSLADASTGIRKNLSDINPIYLAGADAGTNAAVTAKATTRAKELSEAAQVAGDSGLAKTYDDYAIDLEASLTKQLDDVVSDELKLAKFAGKDNLVEYDAAGLHDILKRNMATDDPQRISGIQSIRPFNANEHITMLTPKLETAKDGSLALSNTAAKLNPTNGELDLYNELTTAINQSADVGDYVFDSIDNKLSALGKVKAKLVKDLAYADTKTSFLSTTSKTMHDVEQLQGVAHGADFGIKTPSVKPHAELSSPQAQYNLAHAAKSIKKSGVAAVSGDVNSLTYDKVFKLGFSIANGSDDKVTKLLSGITVNGKPASRSDIEVAVAAKTKEEVITLSMAGKDMLEIANRTGIEKESLGMLAQPNGLVTKLTYKATDNLPHEFRRTLFAVEGRSYETNIAVALDGKLAQEVNANLVELAAVSSQSSSVTGLVAQLSPHSTTSSASLLHGQLSSISPELYSGGRRNFVSLDFSLRHQNIGDAATSLGDAVKKTGENLAETWTKPLVANLEVIAANSVERIQFNKQLNWLYSVELSAGQAIIPMAGKLSKVLKAPDGTVKVLESSDVPLTSLQSKFFEQYRTTYTDMLSVNNFNRRMTGADALQDYGIKLPSQQLQSKYLGFIVKDGKRTEVLHASTPAALEELVKAAREEQLLKGVNGGKVITRGSRFNTIKNYGELDSLGVADVQRAKTSAQFNNAAADGSQIAALMDSLKASAMNSATKSAEVLNQNTLGFLERMHRESNLALINQGVSAKTKEFRTVYGSLHNVILNNKDTIEGSTLDKLYGGLEGLANQGLSGVVDAFKASGFGIGGKAGVATYNDIRKEFKAAGLEQPYASYEAMVRSNLAHTPDVNNASKVANVLAGTTTLFALRFLEVAHGLVTALSSPIMVLPEIAGEMRKAGHGNFSAMKLMTEGVMVGFGPKLEHVAFQKRMIAKGVVAPHISEHATQMAELTVNPSLYSKIVGSKLMNERLTVISDKSEYFARQGAAGVGFVVAKRVLGGDATEAAIDAYASAFVKRTMGNYNAVQRPMAFQGTLGASLGLFQTYILTYGQRVFKSVENLDGRALATMATAQGSIFGLQSLPAYDVFNQVLGNNINNQSNADINTAVYEQFGGVDGDGDTAEALLYGLPSAWLDGNLSSRASIDIRTPISYNPAKGFETDLAILQPIVQVAKTMTRMGDTLAGGGAMSDAIVSAMQMQTLSRPIARMTELVTGKSMDGSGKFIDADTSLAWDMNTVARLFSTRPVQEQTLRDSKWLGSYYSSQDSQRRRSVIGALRFGMRDGTLSEDALIGMQDKYLNSGGSEQRWKALTNEAVLQSEYGADMAKLVGKDTAQHKLLRVLGATGEP